MSECNCEMKLIQVWDVPEMKMHNEDDPIYGDGSGHYWYEGEETTKTDCMICEKCGRMEENETNMRCL